MLVNSLSGLPYKCMQLVKPESGGPHNLGCGNHRCLCMEQQSEVWYSLVSALQSFTTEQIPKAGKTFY